MIPVELTTRRLLLTQPVDADVDTIAAVCGRPEFERFMTTPWPYTRAHAEGFVRSFVPDGWRDDRDYTWAPRVRRDGSLLGMLGLHRHDDGALELGYWLAPDARGRGVMTEASRAVLEWAAAEFGDVGFTWRAVVGNEASRAVALRLGFRMTGVGDDVRRDDTTDPHWFAELRSAELRSVDVARSDGSA